jgi:hypothetical protein
MVRGLLEVEHTDQVCGACLGGKHRRTSFPCQAEYRVEGPGVGTQRSLCGPISLETLSGSRYFLLLADENNRFMWLRTLRSKDQAGVAIKHFQHVAKAETGCRLRAFRTNRGREFTSIVE